MATSISQDVIEKPFSLFQQEIEDRLNNDNDAKIIIQGTNSQTGIGKTTLAIQMCREFDQTDSWSAENKAFLDVGDYLDAHLEFKKGSALLLDEIEAGADNRRAMSQENVDLSQGWATLRARNMVTVATLPSVSMLDKRMLELADYWVLVESRGVAKPYKVVVNDFQPSKLPSRQEFPGGMKLSFDDLPASDSDKKYLDKIKDDHVRELSNEEDSSIEFSEHKERLREEKKDLRNQAIRSVYDATDLSTTDISNMEWCDVSQPQVSNIINGK